MDLDPIGMPDSRLVKLAGLFSRGKTNEEIENEMGITQSQRVYLTKKAQRVLGARDRGSVVGRAYQVGWLKAGNPKMDTVFILALLNDLQAGVRETLMKHFSDQPVTTLDQNGDASPTGY